MAPGALDTFKFKHTPEDAEALAAEMIPAQFAADLGDSNWKVRLAALEEMTGWVEGAAPELDSEVVVRFLGKKGWNEKNFQVSDRDIPVLMSTSQLCSFPQSRTRCRRSCMAFSVSLRSAVRRLADHLSRWPFLIFLRNWET